MRRIPEIVLANVQQVYGGPEAILWELLMGEQIHIGGLESSADLAERAGIGSGMLGVDLCCCTGAGMRFLTRFRGVTKMIGVDATARSIERGRQRCSEQGMADRISFVLADACDSGLADGSADFIWGEDAWCYVIDKKKLLSEAARIARRAGGIIAFTDWVDGDMPMTAAEAERFMRFMKFGSFGTRDDYVSLLRLVRCNVDAAEDTRRFAPCIDLYVSMLQMQLTYDALKIIGFDQDTMRWLDGEMRFVQELAHAGKVIQCLFVAHNS